MVETFQRRIDAKLILSIAACGLMSFSGVVVETAMNVTFPSLMSEFNVSTGLVQWVTTGYLLVLTAIMPLSSLLKRRFHTKALFLAAICLFIAGTLCCGAASAFWAYLQGKRQGNSIAGFTLANLVDFLHYVMRVCIMSKAVRRKSVMVKSNPL